MEECHSRAALSLARVGLGEPELALAEAPGLLCFGGAALVASGSAPLPLPLPLPLLLLLTLLLLLP